VHVLAPLHRLQLCLLVFVATAYLAKQSACIALTIAIQRRTRAGSVWIFQIQFDSVRFSVSSTRFRFSHITAKSAMKAHAVGKTSKGSEVVYAFTPSTSRIDDQQLGLLLTCITGCKRQANTLLKSADCAHCREQKAAAFVLRLMRLHQTHGVTVRLKTIVTLSHTAAIPETKHV